MLRRLRHRSGLFEYLIATIALVSQIALGAIVLPDRSAQQDLAAFAAASIFCNGGHTAGHHAPASHRHRPADPALCPLSIALALPSVILSPVPVLPAANETVLLFRTRERSPGRGRLPATARVGAPRAPPSLTA